jgi:hypothetical protein
MSSVGVRKAFGMGETVVVGDDGGEEIAAAGVGAALASAALAGESTSEARHAQAQAAEAQAVAEEANATAQVAAVQSSQGVTAAEARAIAAAEVDSGFGKLAAVMGAGAAPPPPEPVAVAASPPPADEPPKGVKTQKKKFWERYDGV